MADAIRTSYYHTDTLTGISCSVAIDWPTFFASTKLTISDDRLKQINGLKIHSNAVRGKSPEITFDWSDGPIDTKDQIEGGLKQTIGGFYQMYWPMLAGPLIGSASEINKIEPQPDGTSKVFTSSQDVNVTMTIKKDGSPSEYTVKSPAMNATMDPQYIASPKPAPGDVRRISGLNIVEQLGTSNINVDLALDYQPVDAFYVPGNVTFNVSGAFSLKMEFSGCAVSSTPTAQ
jgi:hypothetical protein